MIFTKLRMPLTRAGETQEETSSIYKFLMRNFANQTMDVAQLLLGPCVEAIGEDGLAIVPEGEWRTPEEPGHFAYGLAILRETGGHLIGEARLVNLIARSIAAQFYFNPEDIEGTTYAYLALLATGLNLERNPVWLRLLPETQEEAEKRLIEGDRLPDRLVTFEVLRALCRYSLGFSKKDDTDRALDRFIDQLNRRNSGGFFDGSSAELGGMVSVDGLLQFTLLREALQRHANSHIRERRLPALRTCAERYLRLLPNLMRRDGTVWFFGPGTGCHALLYAITFVVMALNDGWVDQSRRPTYCNFIGCAFQNLFMQYLDQERGIFVIRDDERDTDHAYTTLRTNFDALRLLLIWNKLAANLDGEISPDLDGNGGGKFVSFDRSNRKEQGLAIYTDPASGLAIQLPLMGGDGKGLCNCLAFPHCPGIFDCPENGYLPILVPELTIDGKQIVPSFYGKNITSGLSLRREFQFKYDQPAAITNREELLKDRGQWKVEWTFAGTKIVGDFTFIPQQPLRLDSFRYAIAVSSPHGQHPFGKALMLGQEGLRPEVLHDDFQGDWFPPQAVGDDAPIRTNIGKVTYLLIYGRDMALNLKPNRRYRFAISLNPDLTHP